MKSTHIKMLILSALMVALTVLGAYIRIPMFPVAITLQTMMVLLSGLLLGSRWGAITQIAYALLGLFGLPVFAGGSSGLTAFLMPSFGFVLSFPVSAAIAGAGRTRFLKNQSGRKGFKRYIPLIIACLIATAVTYLIGIPYLIAILRLWLHKDIGVWAIIYSYCLAFIPGDILKLSLSIAVFFRILPSINTIISNKNAV